jgi:hypothetical protein
MVMRFVPRLKSIVAIFLAIGVAGQAAPFTAFRDGETFIYRVSFAIFSRAGEITITAHEEKKSGVDVMRVTTETRSRGFVRGLYAFDNEAEVVIDKATGRMLHVKDSEISLDYATRTAKYIDRVRTDRTTDISIPEGDPVDLISALVQTRDWNLKPGEKREILVQFGRDFYPLTLTAEGYEEVRTPLGTYQTLVMVPRMEKDPKGLFKKGGEIKVWISQDLSNLPVKMQLKLNFGAATLLLSDYQGPAPGGGTTPASN